MTVFEMAKKYYPRLWDAERIKALLNAGNLTEDEYEALIGEAEERGDINDGK